MRIFSKNNFSIDLEPWNCWVCGFFILFLCTQMYTLVQDFFILSNSVKQECVFVVTALICLLSERIEKWLIMFQEKKKKPLQVI